MSLIRWNPTLDLAKFPSEIFSLQKDINKAFENLFHGGFSAPEFAAAAWSPAVDIAEQDNEFIVKMELPGLTKDDVKITMDANILTVRGEKKAEKETKDKNYHRVERSFGSFERSFALPTTVKVDKIEAVCKDGVLTITAPKTEGAKPKQIEVKVK